MSNRKKHYRVKLRQHIVQEQIVTISVDADWNDTDMHDLATEVANANAWATVELKFLESFKLSTNVIEEAAASIEEVADSLVSFAEELVLKTDGRHDEDAEDDRNLAEMKLDDAADLRQVAGFIRAENFKAAYEKAWSMDTAARDCIPDGAFRLMEENGFTPDS